MRGIWPNNFRGGLFLGILATLFIGLLMGAVRNDPPSLPVAILDPNENRTIPLSNTGRYQVVTWEAGGGYGAFVVDTSTGITKVAYSSHRGPSGNAVNNLGKPFAQMP